MMRRSVMTIAVLLTPTVGMAQATGAIPTRPIGKVDVDDDDLLWLQRVRR